MLHRMSSLKEKLDITLRLLKFSKDSYIKYVLFTNSTHNKRIRGLRLNKYINIKLKYECLEKVGILDIANY